jgi:CubicO group peptidase (beta-lactamase class C family)
MRKIFLFPAFLFASVLSAQNNFKPIDSIVNTIGNKMAPGFSVRVLQHDKVIYSANAGYANIGTKEKITPETMFCMASVTKQFTASCIVLLEQQGKLGFSDKLSKYFPDFPNGEKITIQELLNHTSGIKDIGSLSFVNGELDEEYTNEQVYQLLSKQELNEAPGTKWSYSNSGYWFLAQIVEKVSGQTMEKFAKKHIFKPLKMKDTRYVRRPDNALKNKAMGYEKEGDAYKVGYTDGYVIAGGGMYSNTVDLQKWLTEMAHHKVLGDAFWKIMTETKEAISKDMEYSNGFFVYKYNNNRIIEHGGDVAGFHNQISYFPDKDITVIVLSNDNATRIASLQAAAIDLTLGLGYKYPVKDEVRKAGADDSAVAAEVLEKYTGVYQLEPGVVMSVSVQDGKLALLQLWDGTEYYIEPVAGNANMFGVKDEDISFTFTAIKENKAQTVLLTQNGKEAPLKRLSDKEVNALANGLTQFSGEYKCAKLSATYAFFVENGILKSTVNGQDIEDVSPEGEDKYVISRGHITFKRDAENKIIGFTLNHTRVKNMEFVKV